MREEETLKMYEGEGVTFNRCFAVYPLPSQFHSRHEVARARIGTDFPFLKLGSKRIPHITLCMFPDLSEATLNQVAEVLSNKGVPLLGQNLRVGGAGEFRKGEGGVYFKVEHSPDLLVAHDEIRDSFGRLANVERCEDLELHVTAGSMTRKTTPKQRNEFIQKDRLWREVLDGEDWPFTTDRIVVYGSVGKNQSIPLLTYTGGIVDLAYARQDLVLAAA